MQVKKQTSVVPVAAMWRWQGFSRPRREENLPFSPLLTVHLLSMIPGNERDVWGPKRQERKRPEHRL